MKIYYGLISYNIDVTDICFTKLQKNNIITIPYGDNNRSAYFGDPVNGTLKKIIIIKDNITYEYEDIYTIQINLINEDIQIIDNSIINNLIESKLADIHSKLVIKYGSFNEEFPEQKMAIRYLTGNEKILEIGGNIGRNSLIISYILGSNDKYLVTLESDINIANQLIENRNLNNFNFNIENSALSKRLLIQKSGTWDTIPSDSLLEGHEWVNIISFKQLQNKYNIIFDTLVLDCEGAFYYILLDMPEILDNINLIIMENDYYDISKKQYVDDVLVKNNFYRNYVEAGGWGPCYNNFFEVWKK